METNDTVWFKVFLILGILTIISGIYLFTQGDYFIGTSGTIVGISLTALNWKKIKKK